MLAVFPPPSCSKVANRVGVMDVAVPRESIVSVKIRRMGVES
jgi:hypothetical protein